MRGFLRGLVSPVFREVASSLLRFKLNWLLAKTREGGGFER